MRYYFRRYWFPRKSVVILFLLVAFAALITVLRCFNSVYYNMDLQRAGTYFSLKYREELWLGNALFFSALPSYAGASITYFFTTEAVLFLIFPIILGLTGFQVCAEDMGAGMSSLVIPRMGRLRYFIANGVGIVVSRVILTVVFLVSQLVFSYIGAMVLKNSGIAIKNDSVGLQEILGSLTRWVILNASYSLVAYSLSLFCLKHKVISQLLYLAVAISVTFVCMEKYMCSPMDMAGIESYLNHPSMTVFWGWILVSCFISVVLVALKCAANKLLPEEKVSETFL